MWTDGGGQGRVVSESLNRRLQTSALLPPLAKIHLCCQCPQSPLFGRSGTHLHRTTPPPHLTGSDGGRGGQRCVHPVRPFSPAFPFPSTCSGELLPSFLAPPISASSPFPKGVMARAVVLVGSLALAVLVCALPYATAFVLPSGLPPNSPASSALEGDGRRTMSPSSGDPASLEQPLTRLAAAKKKFAGSSCGTGGSTSAAAPSPSKKKQRKGDEVGKGDHIHSYESSFCPSPFDYFPCGSFYYSMYVRDELTLAIFPCYVAKKMNSHSLFPPPILFVCFTFQKTGAGATAGILYEGAGFFCYPCRLWLERPGLRNGALTTNRPRRRPRHCHKQQQQWQ